MNLSVISKKIKQYPLLVVSLVIVVLCGTLFIMRGPKIKQFQDEITRLDREWENVQTNLERSAGLDVDIADIQSGLEQIQSRLMHADEVAANYEFFYSMEKESGVQFMGFSQGVPSDGSSLQLSKAKLEHFSVLPCDIAMNGNISQILTFMNLLDHQDYIIRFDLLNVGVPADAMNNLSRETVLMTKLRCSVLAAKDE